MKQLIPLIVILILPFVSASILSEDWVNSGETFKVGSNEFFAQYIESTSKVLLKMNDIGSLMLIGECETKGDIKYCFDEVKLPAFNEDKPIEIKIIITSLEPEFSIERTFSTKKPYINEDIKVTATLANTGEQKASKVKYADPYPSAFSSLSSRWEGSLNNGEEHTFSYTVTPKEITTFNSRALITYDFNGIAKKIQSSSITIEVQKPFEITHQISTLAADKNEILDYNITISNRDSEKRLEVTNLAITIPAKLKMVSVPSALKKEENKLTFKGTLEKEEKRTFTIRLSSPNVGKFNLKLDAEFKISAKNFEEELAQAFTVGISDIVPFVDISPEAESSAPYDAHISVQNLGDEQINDVHLILDSDLLEPTTITANIAPRATYTIVKKTLTAPYTEQDQTHKVRLHGYYESATGKNKTFEASTRVSIKAASKAILITRKLNQKTYAPGDKIEVKVYIKNQKDTPIDNIDVTDIFPKEIRSSLDGDVTATIPQLPPNAEKWAYTYTIRIPLDYDKEDIEITTTLNTKIDGVLTILKRPDVIRIMNGPNLIPPMPTEAHRLTNADAPKQPKTSNQTEADAEEGNKEGFFAKVIKWIKALFKRET